MIAILLKFQLLRYLLILFEYSSEIRKFVYLRKHKPK